jgi:mono/diheme cytochrome c family protein
VNGLILARTRPRLLPLFSALMTLVLLDGRTTTAHAQAAPAERRARTGPEVYRDGCQTCHGADGRGGERSQLGFEDEVPDFTKCAFATPEPDLDWVAIVHRGGPVRAFSRRMPAFDSLLSDEEIERVVTHLRAFCTSRSWPPGDLNLPRALFTEKAFPENEAVLTTSIDRGPMSGLGNVFLYEHRMGARTQFEASVPVAVESIAGTWERGLGDVAVAMKHALFHSRERGGIVSGGVEAILPTGSEEHGLGRGVTIVEPFLAFGQILPSDGFLQVHTGLEFPTNRAKSAREVFVRTAVGKSFMEGRWGRSWSPMVELLAIHEFAIGEPTMLDVVPQVQVTLSRRQHLMFSAGVKMPINERGERKAQLVTYLLWDWFDGGLFDGWR